MNDSNESRLNNLPAKPKTTQVFELNHIEKIPPQAVELEKAVLGAMMISKRGVNEVIDILQIESFYVERHQFIFEAMLNLFNGSSGIDLLTVSKKLKENGNLEKSGGQFYLIQLTKLVSSSAHIEYHARIVMQMFTKRSLIDASNEIIKESFDEANDIFDLLNSAESKIFEISQRNIKKSIVSSKELIKEAKLKIKEISKQKGLSGVPSGFNKVDLITSGWQKSDLIIMAARPGMGKTAMSLSMARNISVEKNKAVAFFSLEMSSVQLITRLISSETGISSEKLRTGRLEKHEWEILNDKVTAIENASIFIDDTPALTIFELRAKARRLSSQHNIDLIIIDYLQLMTLGTNLKNGNREQEISTISRNLKALAKELDIPIIALSQLSRAVETRGGTKRPLLSDLRESGAIEQDADIVTFIYRPEYYKIDEWDDNEASPTEGEAELIIAKHRNGALGSIRLKFISHLGKFENLENLEDSNVFQSKINSISPSQLPSQNETFQVYDSNDDKPDSDVPF